MNTQNSIETFYTRAEEASNLWTSVLGVVASVIAATWLVLRVVSEPDLLMVSRLVAASIYGVSLVLLYLCSLLYHAWRALSVKRFLRKLDHASIYIFIAGSYTPFLLVPLAEQNGTRWMAIVWGIALVGTLFKLGFTGRFDRLTTFSYVGLGWLVVLILPDLLQHLPSTALWWLVAGGVTYTLGVAFFLWEKLPHNHALWHIFVMGGSVCHFVAIANVVL